MNSLEDFIKVLENSNELIRIQEYADPELEIPEIVDRMSKTPGGGKALLFENTGTEIPLLINAFGSLKRICIALGVEKLDDVGKRIDELLNLASTPKESFIDKIKMIPFLKEVSDWFPKEISKKGECQQNIVKDPDLSKFPILKCWPNDGGRFVTLPIVITKDPESGVRNVGMYRMQVFEKDLTGMHWHKHKVGARHYEGYKKQNMKMPIAVVLGGDPINTFVATAPLPDHIDEFLFAGFLRNKKVELVKCITQEIEVPANADIVIEGYVDPNEDMLWEGPFGDHTGFYSLPDWYPAFHVTCITHKNNPVYPATIVGIPPQEDFYLGKATERIFLNPIKFTIVPEIVDLDLPPEGVAHNLTIVKINKRYSGQGLKVINSMWGAGQMMFNKVMIVVDQDVNSYYELARIIHENTNFQNDIIFSRGPLDVLDHAATKLGFGGKLGIDATIKYEDEKSIEILHTGKAKPMQDIPTFIKASNNTLIEKEIPLLFLSADYTESFDVLVNSIQGNVDSNNLRCIVFVDNILVDSDVSVLFWVILNNIDPNRDCIIVTKEKNPILYVDGRRKVKDKNNFTRDWPNIIVSNDDTIDLVDKKWESYGIGDFIPSPSKKYRKFLYGNEAKASD